MRVVKEELGNAAQSCDAGSFAVTIAGGFTIDEALNRRTYGKDVTTDMIVNGKVEAPPGTRVLWKLLEGSSAKEPTGTSGG